MLIISLECFHTNIQSGVWPNDWALLAKMIYYINPPAMPLPSFLLDRRIWKLGNGSHRSSGFYGPFIPESRVLEPLPGRQRLPPRSREVGSEAPGLQAHPPPSRAGLFKANFNCWDWVSWADTMTVTSFCHFNP